MPDDEVRRAKSLLGKAICIPIIIPSAISETTMMSDTVFKRTCDGSEDTEWRTGQPVASYADAIITDTRSLYVRAIDTDKQTRTTLMFCEPSRGGPGTRSHGCWLDLATAERARELWRRTT